MIHITGHWFVVLSRSGNTLRTAEGNFDDKARVTSSGWGIKNGKLYNLAANSARTFEYGYHYKFADSSTAVSFSDLPEKLSVGSNDAVIALKMNKSSGMSLTAYGAKIYTAYGGVLGSVSSKPSSSYASNTYVDLWYTVSSAMGVSLAPGRTYQFEFWATVDGVTYTSAKRTITTTGTASYKLNCYINFSGKNYLYDSDFTTLNTAKWASRDTSVYTLAADSTVKHNPAYNTLKITGTSAGSSGKDLRIETMTQGTRTYEEWVGDNKAMTLSFWAKGTVEGAKLYVRWGYESTNAYRSVTLHTDWTFYTIQMDKTTDYYAKAVAWAAKNGIVSGTDATHFSPNGSVTREQVASILYRYASYKGYDVYGRANILHFPDANRVSAYARNAMSWAYAQGLISGNRAADSTVYLDSKGNATRAQVAAIFMRYVQNIVSGEGNTAADRWPPYTLTGTDKIKLYVPTAWTGQYLLQEGKFDGTYYITISSKLNYDRGFGGNVVSIMLTNYKTESEIRYPCYEVVGKWSGGLVIAVYPTDVQWDTRSTQCGNEYRMLEADIPMLLWLMEIKG